MAGFIVTNLHANLQTNLQEVSQVSRPVAWGEMDLFGHLNNVHYFRYIEDARIRLLEQINFFETGLYCVILKNECEYKQPVTYPDILTTRSYIIAVGNTSFSMHCDVYSETQEKLVAIGKSVIVTVEPTLFQKQAIPEQIRAALVAYMAAFK